jgi:glucose/arabinose dehydrogenase
MSKLDARRFQRRAVVAQAALGGLAVAGASLLTGLPSPARAVPSDPDHGSLVTPDPLKAPIAKSGVAVELADFCTPPRTGGSPPYALLNYLYQAGHLPGWLCANDSRGKLWLIDRATGVTRLFLDLAQVRGGKFLMPGRTTNKGLRSFAFHPDAARRGRPGHRKLYTVSTETAASRPAGVKVFGGPFPVLFHDVVAEWQVDAADPMRVSPSSRREVFRIAQYAAGHNTDQLVFDARAEPRTGNHGKLFVGIGDGKNSPTDTDPYDQAQDPGQARGKILRVDPLRQANGDRYGVPADNPFVGRSGHLPEVWALGLRHPGNLSFDRGGDGEFLVTDIGQAQVEEINLGRKGANYGWPLREGTFVTDRTDPASLYALGSGDAAKGFTYPVAQYDHGEGRAITGGFVYRGAAIPALAGHYLCGDIVNGRVFHVPVADLVPGRQAELKELTLRRDGREVTLRAFAAAVGASRVDLRFGQDAAGEVYVLTKQEGKVRRLRPA